MKSAIARSASSNSSPGEDEREPGLGVDHRLPGPDSVELGEDRLGVGAQELGQVRVELRAGASARELRRRIDTPDAVRNLGELRQLGEPRRQRNVVSPQSPGQPLPFHCS